MTKYLDEDGLRYLIDKLSSSSSSNDTHCDILWTGSTVKANFETTPLTEYDFVYIKFCLGGYSGNYSMFVSTKDVPLTYIYPVVCFPSSSYVGYGGMSINIQNTTMKRK